MCQLRDLNAPVDEPDASILQEVSVG